jgi:hypothetical protein
MADKNKAPGRRTLARRRSVESAGFASSLASELPAIHWHRSIHFGALRVYVNVMLNLRMAHYTYASAWKADGVLVLPLQALKIDKLTGS